MNRIPVQRDVPVTIFSKIIEGKIPCHRVFENDQVLAFLDVNPTSPGHTLVVPKEVAQTMDQLSEESAAALGRVLPKICRAVIRATGTKEYNVLQNNGAIAGQSVFHVHFHVIPKPSLDQGLEIEWPARPLDQMAGQALAAKIRDELDE